MREAAAVKISGNVKKMWKFVIGMPDFTRYNEVKPLAWKGELFKLYATDANTPGE